MMLLRTNAPLPLAIFVLIITISRFGVVMSFNPAEEDFCSLKCTYYQVVPLMNSGCDCKTNPECQLLAMTTEEVEEFRWRMVKTHNELREELASGGLTTNYSLPAAADMSVVSYDVGLEYVAACRAINCTTIGHDACRCTRSFPNFVGQTIWTSPNATEDNLTSKVRNYEDYIKIQFDEVQNFTVDNVDNYTFKHEYAHFAAIIWSTNTHIGCAVGVAPRVGTIDMFKFVCNYGGIYPYNNMDHKPVYSPGDGCSKCARNTSCNKIYTHLCGEVETIPTQHVPLPEYDTLSEASIPHNFFQYLPLLTVMNFL